MSEISKIIGYEILDSRGNPTVEAKVSLTNGKVGFGVAPSGASTGSREALELRDKDPARFNGKGVLKAVAAINQVIAPKLKGFKVGEQQKIDEALLALDGTENKENLGANALLAVSLAVANAAAQDKNVPLFESLSQLSAYQMPVPMMNIINGGQHANNNLDIQEFMILPVGASSFKEAVRFGAEIFHRLKSVLQKMNLNTSVGDEGGFAPNLPHNIAVLDTIAQAIHQAGFHLGKDIYLGLDVASSEFYANGLYHLSGENKKLTSLEFVDYLKDLTEQYPIISIEDGMGENDWDGWQALTNSLGQKVQLVGDDLFVTNTKIFSRGIEANVANAILIKPNQIGTLTETLNTIAMAKKAHYNTIISHRSGETEDTFIADLAVATNARQIKTGSLCRSDRVAKYNQLMRIEALLGSNASFAGIEVFKRFENLTQMEVKHDTQTL